MSQQENAKKAQLFSARLTGARNRAALSQDELAEKAEVSLRSVQNWESGEADMPMPQGKNLRKICEILGVSAAYLFGEEERYPKAELRAHLIEERRSGTEGACREHLNQFLEGCEGDEVRLGWTYVELRQHFPLDKWIKDAPVEGVLPESRAAALEAARRKVKGEK